MLLVLSSFFGEFTDTAADVPDAKNEINEKDAFWDIRDLTSKDDRELSALNRDHAFCGIMAWRVFVTLGFLNS